MRFLKIFIYFFILSISILGKVDIKSFGAKGDGITDDTEAFNKAMAYLPKKSTLYIPSGVYKGNFIFQHHQITGDGDTIFIANNHEKPIITLKDPGGWDYQIFQNAIIDGQGKTKTLVQFGETMNDVYAGRWSFKNVSLINASEVAVKKIGGNIGTHWEECDFSNNPIHFYARNTSNPGKIMHVGCDTFNKSYFSESTKTVWIYIEDENKGKNEGGQIIIRDCIAENNTGAVFIAKNFGKGMVPIVIENLWLEGNSKSPLLAIDIYNEKYMGREFHIEDVGRIKIEGTYIHNSYFKKSNVSIINCEISDSYQNQAYTLYNKGVQIENIDSNITIANSFTRSGWGQIDNNQPPLTVKNHMFEPVYISGGSLGYYSSQPNNIYYYPQNANVIINNNIESLDKKIDFGENSMSLTLVDDGVMKKKSIEFEVIQDGGICYVNLMNSLKDEVGKYAVITFNIKPMNFHPEAKLKLTAGSGDMGILNLKKIGKWNFYRLSFYVGDIYKDYGNLGFWFDNAPKGFKFRLCDLQILFFDTLAEANAFIDNGYFASNMESQK
ncbi:glycosyl hydrolase family 28-related protein [Cetobacterium sp.]|uniref:glycosyl hydrolase family 28-related protein n=1 Tax=Cetobacterium sp. TaxID=2071632 RepID=UPI003F36120D